MEDDLAEAEVRSGVMGYTTKDTKLGSKGVEIIVSLDYVILKFRIFFFFVIELES